MNRNTANFLHIFLLLAFIMAGVSPACRFISGEKTFMEICFSDGSLKRVEIPSGYAPPADKEQPAPPRNNSEHGIKKDCAFCFAQSHIAKNGMNAFALSYLPPARSFTIGAGSFVIFESESSPFDSRGPPALS